MYGSVRTTERQWLGPTTPGLLGGTLLSRRLGWQDYENGGRPPPPDASPVEAAPSAAPSGTVAETPTTSVKPPPVAPTAASTADDEPTETVASAERPKAPPRAFPIVELLWLCVALADAVLALDFIFRALAAQAVGFVGAVVAIGNALAGPFRGVLSGRSLPVVDHTSYWEALVAIVVYTLAVALLLQFLRLIARPASRSGGNASRRRSQ
jgi:hypothetical protein